TVHKNSTYAASLHKLNNTLISIGRKPVILHWADPLLTEEDLLAKEHDIGLTVDAEESERLDLSLDIIEAVFSGDDLAGWNGFGVAVQAYQKRALFVIEWLRYLTQQVGRKMMVRLVKGAYWDTEIKNAQKDGLEHFPVFTRKPSTDVSYHACANKLLEYRDTIYPQFATHNAYTASIILELAGDDKQGFEFQCLHGMGDALYDQIVTQENIQCRVYAPVGEHEDLLAYLVRRLLENGANSSFVNAIMDVEKPVEELLEDPVERTQRLKNVYNTQIRLPIELYGEERANSKGMDLTDAGKITVLRDELDAWFAENHLTGEELQAPFIPVRNPANQNQAIGYHQYTTTEQMMVMLDKADKAFATWSTTDIDQRCKILCDAADALERNTPELIALCIKEAGKVAQDGVDEVREAVDFLRYYAARAKELVTDERLKPRGVVLCISPWNFPLAIFTGQLAAAIAVGNTVIAKPAEQTSLIAKRAIEIMNECGLPKDVVQTVIAPGPAVGRALLPDSRIAAVMFTGSTQTGSLISQILAERGGEQVPLIAETGGQNCMIVDSPALPEQVVDDVITSSFQSAGQRCSALRVLFVQEDIADNLIRMLKGAMKELHVGDPAMLATDVGPVIDQRALDTLNAHVEYMQDHGTLLYECELSPETKNGFFFAPKLYELDSIDELQQEVFGPCLHVIRFKVNEIQQVVDKINSTGFGLTMGIHSRIEQRVADLAQRSRAGNIYINRNMIGAIVGVQPFGGRGLSGTGPKAGGPNYLPRLMKEVSTPKEDELRLDDAALETDDKAIIQATRMMQKAQAVVDNWRLTSLNDRISLVRQLLAKIAGTEHSQAFADDLDATLATARSQLIEVERKMKKATILPGPTGESNTLYLDSRGILVCFADKEVTYHYWLMSIVTALSTGNTVIAVVSDVFYKEAIGDEKLFEQIGAPKGIFQVARLKHIQPLLAHDALAGVVIDSKSRR
ncbi:MAG: bifunctional proline dehydrogenase/L-glutamate gamma-semialdehyde dehydrogenase PutA, partial [Candidatus Electrothrix sp. AS4_5]|nr:bifunctional proline dehydrogenase/L-glutamate gamma-semialdehyde dehydrogenase PutA [Candidatus Electrothrix gigas]